MIKRFINYVALLVLLAVCYSTTQATPLVKLRIGERTVVGNTYFADVMADVAPGETWKMSGVFLFSYNPAALNATDFNFMDYPEEEIASKIIYNLYPAVLARVGAAPEYVSGDYPRAAQFGMDNVNNMFYWNLAYMGNTNADEPVQGTIRIGTLRFTIVNPLELDNIQILDQVNNPDVAVIPQVVNGNIDVENLNFLTYGCDALTCYQIENPTPRQIVPPTASIATGLVEGPFCQGATTNVTFTTPVAFNEGNVFTAQLSDATGSFTTATTIGTLTGTESGTVECTIPALATAGANYRIRVIGSNPVNNGTNNGTDIVINALPTVSEIMSPNPEYCPNSDGSAIVGSGLAGVSYQLFKDDVAFGDAITVEQDGDDLFWSELFAGTYTVVATNAGGCTNEMTGEVVITEAALPTVLALAPATASYCADVNGVTLTLAGSELGISYQLKNNGENVGEALDGTGNDLVWENILAGNYIVEAAFGTECTLAFEGSAVVTENALPTVQALTPSANAYCADVNGVTLTLAGSEAGISYQLFNGANEAGEAKVGTGEAIEWANVLEGTYTVIATNVANDCGRTITANPVVITSTPLPTATISGNATVAKLAPATYTTAVTENATYAWTVTNGTIDGEADEASVNVIWGNEAGNATVSLTKTVNGCSVDATYDVAITEFTVPTSQAKYIIFSGVGQEQMTIRWNRGNGNKVLVVAYPGTAVTTAPTMTTEYDVNDMIGNDGKVVYVGTGKQVTVTGLTPGETYTFKAYEYFSNANNTGIYTLVDAVFNPRSKSTIPSVPTMNAVTNITPSSADLSWTYNGALSYFEVEVATDNAFENIINGWQGADVGDMTELTIGDLEGTTEYFFRVRAVNGYYTSAWASTQFTTIDAEPTELPSDITFANVTDDAMSVSWTGTEGQNYLVIASTDETPVASPVDGIVYDVDDEYGDGFVVYNGDLFDFVATDLDPATMYYFTVFTYNGMISTNYNPEGVIDSNTTLATAPTVPPTAIKFENVTEESMDVSWTASTDATRYIVLGVDEADANNAFDFVNGTEYTTESDLTDAVVLYVGNNISLPFSDLNANEAYTFQVYAFNGAGETTNYLTTPLVGTQVTMKDAPDAPTALTFASITPTSATVNFTKGDGSEFTVVYMNTVNEFTAPAKGTAVTEEDDNVVYVGDASTFNVSGLVAGEEYFFAAYSFNDNHGDYVNDAELANYNSTPANGSFTTLATAPVVAPTTMVFSNVIETSMNVAWTASTDATRYIVLGVDEADANNAFDFVNGTEYTIESDLTDAVVLYVGEIPTFTATELDPNTAYTFQVYAFNGAGVTTNYLATPLFGTQVTMKEAPTTAPSEFEFTGIDTESATVNFTKGNGEFTVVYMNTTNSFTAPAKGTEVTEEDANVVYVGTGESFDLIGLDAGEEYFFAAYSFNDNHGANVNTAELANYNATPATGNFTTLVNAPAPSEAVTYDNVTTTSMDIAWTSPEGATSIVLMNTTGTFATPVNGLPFNNEYVIYSGPADVKAVTGLTANTKYYFAVYNVKGENGTQNYSAISPESFRSTLVAEPDAPTDLLASNITNISMDLAWVNPANSIVMMNTTGNFVAPVDGTEYTIGTNDVIYVGSNTTCVTPVLTGNVKYYFAVYSYNGTGVQINYNTTPATTNATTSRFATVTDLVITNNITFANGTPFNVRVKTVDAEGNGTASNSARTITLSQVGSNGTLYGNLTATIAAGQDTITFRNITFYANSGVSSFTLKVSTPNTLITNFEDERVINVPVAVPTQQDKLILFSGVAGNAMTVKWTKGNGANRILVMKNAPFNTTPATVPSGKYLVDDQFGTLDGTVVYNGSASEKTVTGLIAGTTYYFKAFNYNGTPESTTPAYCPNAGSFNPRSRVAVAKDEVAPQDELTEADINNNNFFVGNINPNPVVNNINFKMTSYEDMTMDITVFDASGREVAKLVDGQLQTKGTQNFSFNLGDNLSSGSYLLVVTAGDQTAVQTFSVVK